MSINNNVYKYNQTWVNYCRRWKSEIITLLLNGHRTELCHFKHQTCSVFCTFSILQKINFQPQLLHRGRKRNSILMLLLLPPRQLVFWHPNIHFWWTPAASIDLKLLWYIWRVIYSLKLSKLSIDLFQTLHSFILRIFRKEIVGKCSERHCCLTDQMTLVQSRLSMLFARSLHILLVTAWVSFGCCSFLPNSQIVQVGR